MCLIAASPLQLGDLLGGQVQVAFASMPSAIQYIRAGQLRALAVVTATRSDLLPDVPTVAEFLPGYEASSWYGVGAPKATSAEIIDKLNKEINASLADPKNKARLADAAYGQAFTNRIRTMGIRDRPIAPRSPWQNPYVDRLIGTLRRECLEYIDRVRKEANRLGAAAKEAKGHGKSEHANRLQVRAQHCLNDAAVLDAVEIRLKAGTSEAPPLIRYLAPFGIGLA